MAITKKNTKTIALGKTQLLSAIAESMMLAPEPVPIDELDAIIYVKRMTIGERDEYFAKMKTAPTGQGTSYGNALAFTLAVVDEKGNYLFADENGQHEATDDDIKAVQKTPPMLIDKALDKFYEVNRFIKIDTAQAQADADGELKNS